MFPQLRVLSRYTGALSREKRLGRHPSIFFSPPLSQQRLLHVAQSFPATYPSVEESHYQRRIFSSSAAESAPFAPAQGQRRGSWTPRRSPPSERLYVGNLTETNRHEVIAFVNALPGFVDIFDQIGSDGRKRTYVHLVFKDTESANNAVNELDQRFEHAELRVDFATSLKGRKLFVGEIPSGVRPWVLQTISDVPGFERFFDYPLKDGSPKDYLHAQFSDGNAATVAHKQLSEALDQHGVRVDFAVERNDSTRPDYSSEHASIPPSSDLFVGNIPFDASESEIAALFNDQPGFIELKLAMDHSGRNKGIAKASFEFIDQATSAMEAINGQYVHDRPIRITFSRVKPTRPVGKTSNMLFIGGLPHNVTEGEVRHGVAGFDGLQQIEINSGAGSGKPAWAVATYETLEQAIAVVEACHHRPLFPGGPPMRIAYRHAKNDSAHDQNVPSTVLFVGGIKKQTRADLHDLFARWKPVSARVVTDAATGDNRGFGFVEFATVDIAASAQKAIHGSDVAGEPTPIRVNFAKPDKDKDRKYKGNTSRDAYPGLGTSEFGSGSGASGGQARGHGGRARSAW